MLGESRRIWRELTQRRTERFPTAFSNWPIRVSRIFRGKKNPFSRLWRPKLQDLRAPRWLQDAGNDLESSRFCSRNRPSALPTPGSSSWKTSPIAICLGGYCIRSPKPNSTLRRSNSQTTNGLSLSATLHFLNNRWVKPLGLVWRLTAAVSGGYWPSNPKYQVQPPGCNEALSMMVVSAGSCC